MEIMSAQFGGKSYSVIVDGMEVALVSGKLRRRAIVTALRAAAPATWQEAAQVARAWLLANPKARRVAA